ncbi:hypothetical protein B566_EDAN013884 [Ephemera danica]|nr:hypothetical protein B566_EDAN013884 [Ephemera danica]
MMGIADTVREPAQCVACTEHTLATVTPTTNTLKERLMLCLRRDVNVTNLRHLVRFNSVNREEMPEIEAILRLSFILPQRILVMNRVLVS